MYSMASSITGTARTIVTRRYFFMKTRNPCDPTQATFNKSCSRYNSSMKDKTIEILAAQIEQEFLPFVRRPARYIGGEVNQVRKDLSRCDLTFALCFPDVYEVGMSNTGIAILYHILNQLDGVAAERVFAPWTDAEQILRQKQIPLFSLESTGIVAKLRRDRLQPDERAVLHERPERARSGGDRRPPQRPQGGRPAHHRRRRHGQLLRADGGLHRSVRPGRGRGGGRGAGRSPASAKRAGKSKSEALREIAGRFDWAYVPQFYDFAYEDSRIASFQATEPDLRTRFENAVVEDFENAPVPTRPIVPFAEAVHERVSIEIMRGCPGRCRFCQASFCRRPIRFRSAEKVFELAKESYARERVRHGQPAEPLDRRLPAPGGARRSAARLFRGQARGPVDPQPAASISS